MNFGVYTAVPERVVTSTAAFNDGALAPRRRHARRPTGMALLRRRQAGRRTRRRHVGQAYNGYWRIGGDSGWAGVRRTFTGSIDEVAIYPARPDGRRRSPPTSRVGTTGAAANVAPTAAFTSATSTSWTRPSTRPAPPTPTAPSPPTPGTSVTARPAPASGADAHLHGAPAPTRCTLTVTDDRGATATDHRGPSR